MGDSDGICNESDEGEPDGVGVADGAGLGVGDSAGGVSAGGGDGGSPGAEVGEGDSPCDGDGVGDSGTDGGGEGAIDNASMVGFNSVNSVRPGVNSTEGAALLWRR